MIRPKLPDPVVRLAISALLLCSFGFMSSAPAQPTPTPAQLEMYRNLPPDQQRALMETITGTGGVGGDTSIRADKALRFPQTVYPNGTAQDTGKAEDDDFDRMGEPRLKGDDTILLSLELREFEVRSPIPETQKSAQDTARDNSAQQPAIPGRESINNSASDEGKENRKRIVRTTEQERRLKQISERVLRRNPYQLDKWGILNVLELGPIPLGGLTVEEASQRISAEVAFRDFRVTVVRLPLRPIETDALRPFGYDLFKGRATTFAPATDIPVPSDYVVGPGDMIEIQLIGGSKAGRYKLVVSRDGRVNFPEIGPITVSGLHFDDARALIEQRVRDQMPGTQVVVGMGELRSIRVFLLGDATTPGAYTVSGLSTITNALLSGGGVKKIGSLRNIELKRNGALVSRFDLYDLLLKGDTRADVRLLPGDVIFIPPVGPTVSLAGEVQRPAIYELKNETSAQELIAMAGGYTPHAAPERGTIERVNAQRQRVTLDINLTQSGNSMLQTGDVVRVPRIRPVLEESVSLVGYVYRPGEFQYRQGMRLTDLVTSIDELRPNADQHYILIRRELPPDRRITVFSADLSQALADPRSAQNFELAPRDRIYVFDLESGRDRIIEPLMRELGLQSSIADPTREVSVAGLVRIPGKYPYEPGMRVSDLLRAGGSLDQAAFEGQAELTRYVVDENGTRKASLIEIDLKGVQAGNAVANLALQPFDYLVIKETPLWGAQEEVEVRGEVRFPGRYPIRRGETLRSLMQRVGGVTELAFVPGTIFTRDELRERERKQIQTLANRMQSDVALVSLQASQETGKEGAAEALAIGQSLLTELRNTQPVGRLVIDLNTAMAARPGSEEDIILKDGDRLLVPRVTQEVTVLGEVQSVTSHLYDPSLTRNDYVQMSGGLTQRADEDRVYVVRADGSVVAGKGKLWFSGGSTAIQPGDTIVAPIDTERMRPLPLWTAVSTLVYNLALTAAAINTF